MVYQKKTTNNEKEEWYKSFEKSMNLIKNFNFSSLKDK